VANANAKKVGSSKGERTRRAVIDAANEILAEAGAGAASQDNVARRAGITQSALRHHFPTKEELLQAVFDDALTGYRESIERILLEPGGSPGVRLTRIVSSHLDYVASASDARTFETFAYWARNAEAREPRQQWYVWLVGHYADLIHRLRPTLDAEDCRERGMQVLTLTLGAWVTLGRTRPVLIDKSTKRTKAALQRAVDAIVGTELPWLS
jgi:AcrR family transcriptional regulator